MRAPKNPRHSALAASLATVLAMALTLLGPATRVALAAPLSTQAMLESTTAAATREQLHQLVDREDVARELERFGVDPVEARLRIAALSDAELAAVQGRLDQLPVGTGAVGAVVGALLIVFLVLLVTDIAGLTDVFPFVRKPARR